MRKNIRARKRNQINDVMCVQSKFMDINESSVFGANLFCCVYEKRKRFEWNTISDRAINQKIISCQFIQKSSLCK